MDRRTGSLVFGIVLLVILVASIGPNLATGVMPGTRQLVFSGALLFFAISRFIMFKSPDSAIIWPMRMIAIAGCVGSFLLKN